MIYKLLFEIINLLHKSSAAGGVQDLSGGALAGSWHPVEGVSRILKVDALA